MFKKIGYALTLLFAISTVPAQAAGVPKAQAVEAAAALERYLSGGSAPWTVESIEIHAALVKLDKSGRLRAIRRVAPTGGSRYEVIQLAGDRTVELQVIARYLNAEERQSILPPESVAITNANYKFAYQGAIDDGEHLAYAFQITPRHKRAGLIKGELWLDQRTGAPVVQFGRAVKSPSVFIKRVSVNRENTLRDGVIESRLTHITVETRLLGRAELVIEERPLMSPEALQLARGGAVGGQQ